MFFLLKKEVIYSTLAKFGFEVVGLTLFEELVIFIVANIFYLLFMISMFSIIFKIVVRIKRIIF